MTVCLWIFRDNDQVKIGNWIWVPSRPGSGKRKRAQIVPFLDPASNGVDD